MYQPDEMPTCCPDAYWCYASGDEGAWECPRHGGFSVCCSMPQMHVPQETEEWHRKMRVWERGLLNDHIRQWRMLQLLTAS